MALTGDARGAGATATVLATIPLAPGGEAPRVPVSTSSLLVPGPTLARAAPARLRTLPDGTVCVAEPVAPGAGLRLIRIDAAGDRPPTQLAPGPPGGRLIDFLTLADGTWVVLEGVPGPPDQVRARRIAADGGTVWSHDSTAGTSDALSGLLCDTGGALFSLAGNSPRRLVALDPDTGAAQDAQVLGHMDGPGFMNGTGRVGYLSADPADGVRVWVTVEARRGDRQTTRLPGASGMESALGLDAEGRSYWSRFTTLLRRDSSGDADWELEVGQAIVDGDRVWIQQRPEGEESLIVVGLPSVPEASTRTVTLRRPDGEPSRHWHLAGREPDDIFVLHGTTGANDAGALARIDAHGRLVDLTPAGEAVWLEWFDLQPPRGPAVTDAGELDIATRGPDGLSVIRIRPS